MALHAIPRLLGLAWMPSLSSETEAAQVLDSGLETCKRKGSCVASPHLYFALVNEHKTPCLSLDLFARFSYFRLEEENSLTVSANQDG